MSENQLNPKHSMTKSKKTDKSPNSIANNAKNKNKNQNTH